MPETALFVLLVLTVYRTTRLIMKDTLPPVLWLRDRLAGGWRPLTAKEQSAPTAVSWRNQTEYHDDVLERYIPRASWSPYWLAELITCPWCASGWVTGALMAVTDVTYGVPAPWLVGPAVWAASALLASRDWA